MIFKGSSASKLGKVGRAYATITSGTAVASLCSLIALALNARSLGAEQFGMLALIQAYVSFIAGLTTFDNWQPVVRLALRSPNKLGLVLGSGIAMDVSAAVAATVIALVGLGLFVEGLGFGAASTIPLLAYALSLLANVGGTGKGYFRYTGNFGVLAWNQVAYAVLQVICAALLWMQEAHLHTYFIVFGVLNAFPGLAIMLRMLMTLRAERTHLVNPLSLRSRRRYFGLFFRVGIGNSILSTFATSRLQIALFVISAILGNHASGLFAAASRCASALTRFVSPINQVIFPEIMRYAREHKAESLRGMMRRMTVLTIFVVAAVAAIGALGSNFILTSIVGHQFIGAANIFIVLLLAEVVMWIGIHLNPIVINAMGQRPLLVLNIAVGATSLLISIEIAARFGPEGVAAVLLAGALLIVATLYCLAERAINSMELLQSVGRP